MSLPMMRTNGHRPVHFHTRLRIRWASVLAYLLALGSSHIISQTVGLPVQSRVGLTALWLIATWSIIR